MGVDELDLSPEIRMNDVDIVVGKGRAVLEGMSCGRPAYLFDSFGGDGWVTAVVWRAAENRSDFVVFDAQAIAKGPIAIAELPRRVPFGFHGNWVSA